MINQKPKFIPSSASEDTYEKTCQDMIDNGFIIKNLAANQDGFLIIFEEVKINKIDEKSA